MKDNFILHDNNYDVIVQKKVIILELEENLSEKFKRYLAGTISVSVEPESWEGARGLPFFLRNLYSFFRVSILGTPCIVMVPKEDVEQTPAAVCKHIRQLQKEGAHVVLYANEKISAYNRKRLIEHKVPFVVPGNQMYLPPLGIDLREHFKTIRDARSTLRPSTQIAFLFALMQDHGLGVTPKALAERLGYTPMSMTRAFDELESAELGRVAMEGRQRILRRAQDRKALWGEALKFLRNPVKKRFWVRLVSTRYPGVEAGLTALARYSSLAGPSNPVFAMDNKAWREIESSSDVIKLPIPEPDACQLEIWSYSPDLLAENGVADPFSLYLSLKGTEDERVESALEEMMEQFQW